MNAWADARKQDLRELEEELRDRLRQAGWWLAQLLVDPDGRWLCVITQEDTGLKLAYSHEKRHEALRAAVTAAEGRRGRE